ncbi:hypothetical protein DPX16_21535 [Anabarilius grahami]|uniref:Uncharacterized protein n=1 Tax=Anabarilius grahami TaxID=495550 RepID=A0A3N0XUN5_ANAGA|nr:hypothetical protein DPX16_21535 [Anabarilius grahami]
MPVVEIIWCGPRGIAALAPNKADGWLGSSLFTNPFEGMKEVGDQKTVPWNALLRHFAESIKQAPFVHKKNQLHSVVNFEILHPEGDFEVASSEHFGLVRPVSMAAMIVLNVKCPWEVIYPILNTAYV